MMKNFSLSRRDADNRASSPFTFVSRTRVNWSGCLSTMSLSSRIPAPWIMPDILPNFSLVFVKIFSNDCFFTFWVLNHSTSYLFFSNSFLINFGVFFFKSRNLNFLELRNIRNYDSFIFIFVIKPKTLFCSGFLTENAKTKNVRNICQNISNFQRYYSCEL